MGLAVTQELRDLRGTSNRESKGKWLQEPLVQWTDGASHPYPHPTHHGIPRELKKGRAYPLSYLATNQ